MWQKPCSQDVSVHLVTILHPTVHAHCHRCRVQNGMGQSTPQLQLGAELTSSVKMASLPLSNMSSSSSLVVVLPAAERQRWGQSTPKDDSFRQIPPTQTKYKTRTSGFSSGDNVLVFIYLWGHWKLSITAGTFVELRTFPSFFWLKLWFGRIISGNF